MNGLDELRITFENIGTPEMINSVVEVYLKREKEVPNTIEENKNDTLTFGWGTDRNVYANKANARLAQKNFEKIRKDTDKSSVYDLGNARTIGTKIKKALGMDLVDTPRTFLSERKLDEIQEISKRDKRDIIEDEGFEKFRREKNEQAARKRISEMFSDGSINIEELNDVNNLLEIIGNGLDIEVFKKTYMRSVFEDNLEISNEDFLELFKLKESLRKKDEVYDLLVECENEEEFNKMIKQQGWEKYGLTYDTIDDIYDEKDCETMEKITQKMMELKGIEKLSEIDLVKEESEEPIEEITPQEENGFSMYLNKELCISAAEKAWQETMKEASKVNPMKKTELDLSKYKSITYSKEKRVDEVENGWPDFSDSDYNNYCMIPDEFLNDINEFGNVIEINNKDEKYKQKHMSNPFEKNVAKIDKSIIGAISLTKTRAKPKEMVLDYLEMDINSGTDPKNATLVMADMLRDKKLLTKFKGASETGLSLEEYAEIMSGVVMETEQLIEDEKLPETITENGVDRQTSIDDFINMTFDDTEILLSNLPGRISDLSKEEIAALITAKVKEAEQELQQETPEVEEIQEQESEQKIFTKTISSIFPIEETKKQGIDLSKVGLEDFVEVLDAFASGDKAYLMQVLMKQTTKEMKYLIDNFKNTLGMSNYIEQNGFVPKEVMDKWKQMEAEGKDPFEEMRKAPEEREATVKEAKKQEEWAQKLAETSRRATKRNWFN